jgi:hypothetical protein
MARSPSPQKRYSSRQREKDYRDLDRPERSRSRSYSPARHSKRRTDDSHNRGRDDDRDYRRAKLSRSPPPKKDRYERSPDRRGGE